MRYLLISLLTVIASCAFAYQGYPVNAMLSKATYHMIRPDGGYGTGFAVTSGSGRVVMLTNWHVCDRIRNNKLKAVNDYYGVTVEVEIVKMDPQHDLCALTAPYDKSPLKLAKRTKFGNSIFSAGYPGSFNGKINHTQGHVVAETEVELNYPSDQGRCPSGFTPYLDIDSVVCNLKIVLDDTDLFGEPGISGSPVVNSKGELVGVMNSARTTRRGSYGSFVPFRDVKSFVESI